jgi:hypothetical protein
VEVRDRSRSENGNYTPNETHMNVSIPGGSSEPFSRCAERGIEIELGFESRQLRGVPINDIGPKKNFQRNFSHAALAARPAKLSAVDNKSRGGFDLPPHA